MGCGLEKIYKKQDMNKRNHDREMEKLEEALRGMERPTAPGDLAERLVAAIPEGVGIGDSGLVAGRWYMVLRWAAVVMIGLGGIIFYVTDSGNNAMVEMDHQAGLVEAIEAEAMSARLLASANILAKQPAGLSYAEDTYRYLIESYPETTAGQEAKQLLEKKDKEMH